MPRVLVIEDDRFNRRLYRDLLEAEGHEVEMVGSATEGLAAARRNPPELVVMDVELPGMNGLEATRTLKSDPVTGGVRVLVVSAHAFGDPARSAGGAGADAFLAKPLSFPEFQEVVRGLVYPA